MGIRSLRVSDQAALAETIRDVLESPGPVVCEVLVEPDQPIGPRVTSRIGVNGKMVSSPLEDLYPFLDREELRANMLVPLIQE
jgi:acetolactate synthase-1/2/3 large subunit